MSAGVTRVKGSSRALELLSSWQTPLLYPPLENLGLSHNSSRLSSYYTFFLIIINSYFAPNLALLYSSLVFAQLIPHTQERSPEVSSVCSASGGPSSLLRWFQTLFMYQYSPTGIRSDIQPPVEKIENVEIKSQKHYHSISPNTKPSNRNPRSPIPVSRFFLPEAVPTVHVTLSTVSHAAT